MHLRDVFNAYRQVVGKKAVFMEHVFQQYLKRLESERSQLEQVFQAEGIA